MLQEPLHHIKRRLNPSLNAFDSSLGRPAITGRPMLTRNQIHSKNIFCLLVIGLRKCLGPVDRSANGIGFF